ncbi:lysozyme inhibitor LprI family protein [Duganella callida]|uniref:DUF1311 domain-containing protein n=1 Tax=Duganella callida TaxID=2561932 RepID=A0A4Y9S7K8_9BURK|nr:lysozyme inhibitor LprI family protein [Duganella callida]TFW17253.1 DUF1311 domain-containing protein [Duganella callida]
MKTTQITLLALALFSPLSSAFAGGIKLSPAFDKCITKAGAVDPAVLECIGNEHEVQDRRLNSSYKALMAKLGASRKKQLQEAQRLWLKYVEANCDFYYDPNGGTSARMMSAQCSVDARAQRAGELEDLAKWN